MTDVDTGRVRVLVVDDDETTRKQLNRILSKEGCDVLLAADGAQAAEVFENERPGIVMTDLRMPKIDGMELLHHVKKMEPLTQVILITAHGDYDLAIHALRGGALDYLRKPIDLDQLFLAIGRAKENLARFRDVVARPKVLIVEDDETARNRLSRVLSKEGYNVFAAADGDEGVRMFEENRPDVVMTDLKLPKKNGLEVLRAVRGISDSVETILFTGYGDEEAAIDAMREGATNYLRKPIDLDQMLIAIQKALEKLSLKRSVSFRKREVELAQEIVAKLTSRKELMINIREGTPQGAIDFAEGLIDTVPLNLLVLDAKQNVLFANRFVKERAGEMATTITSELLGAMGLTELSLDAFSETATKVLHESAPAVECIEVSKYAFVMMTKLFVVTDSGTNKVLLVILRGERGCAPTGSSN